MENLETLTTLDTQDTGQINVRENQRAIKNTQSRDTGNIGYTRHKTNKRQRKPKGNDGWIIQRHWQHWIHKTQDTGQINVRENERVMTDGESRDTGLVNDTYIYI